MNNKGIAYRNLLAFLIMHYTLVILFAEKS